MADPLPPSAFRIHERPRPDGAIVVAVFGELDLCTCPQLDAVLTRLAAQQSAVVLDLMGVEFMDSTGLNLLVTATRGARRDGWSFALDPHLPAEIAQLFDLASMHDHLPFDGPA
jgi:anti-sigma B factor antagonist